MKTFLQKTFLFLLPVVLLLYPADYFISQHLRLSHHSPAEYEVWNDIYASKANTDVAIYGSSRAWLHFDPQILSDTLHTTVYNFGMDGQNFWLQYLRHLELLRFNKKPKTIILSLDIFSLEKGTDLYEANQFLPYMLWNKNVFRYTRSYSNFTPPDYCIPLVRYLGKSKVIKTSIDLAFRKPGKNFRKNGFAGMDMTWNNDFDSVKKQMNGYEMDFDESTLRLLENFIIECKRNNIQLIFVYSPEYIDGQKFVLNRTALINIYRNFSKKYNVTLLDFSNDSICLHKEYFYNALHLNRSGATAFTKKLASQLKALKLIH